MSQDKTLSLAVKNSQQRWFRFNRVGWLLMILLAGCQLGDYQDVANSLSALKSQGGQIRLDLDPNGLSPRQPLLNPRLQVKRLDATDEPAPGQVNWRHQQGKLVLAVDQQPARYSITVVAERANQLEFRRKFVLEIDAFGQLKVQLNGKTHPRKILSGNWLPYRQRYALKWSEKVPRTRQNLTSAFIRGETKSLLRLHQQKVIWVHPTGNLAYGRLEDQRLVWLAEYHHDSGYDNIHPPTTLIFNGEYLYLGTAGGGIFVGRLADDRIEWRRHYPGNRVLQSSNITSLSIHQQTIAIGSADNGILLADLHEEQLTRKHLYAAGQLSGSVQIQHLILTADHLLWNSTGRDLFVAPLTAEQRIENITHASFPTTRSLSSPVLSSTYTGNEFIFGTQNGVYIGQFSEGRFLWREPEKSQAIRELAHVNAVVADQQLLVLGSGHYGLYVGTKDEQQISWHVRHYQRDHSDDEHLGGMLDARVLDIGYHGRYLLVHSADGLASARLQFQQTWQLIEG